MIFLVDRDRTYSYEELLSAINSDATYTPYFRSSDLFSFFRNLVKSIVHSKDVVLLDSDLKDEELTAIDPSEVNRGIELPAVDSIGSVGDMITAVRQSQSKITIFTSGTTGQPKQVVHGISTLTRSVRIGDNYKSHVWGFAYNPTHMAGLQVFFQAFENINPLVNLFNYTRQEVFFAIDSNQITHLSATPTFYRLLMPFESEHPSVQRITLGGEKSDSRLYETIKQIFPLAKINNVYASTEAGSLFAAKGDAFQIPSDTRDRFKVVDNELLIHRSMLGESSSFTFVDDFYCTGDLIEWVDEEAGVFRFISRKNELINVGGYKVNPGEVESAILSIDGVVQALVYGKANSILGNVLCTDIQVAANIQLTELDIKNALKERLQDFKIPRKIKFVNTFTLTKTGKIKRI